MAKENETHSAVMETRAGNAQSSLTIGAKP
jgi:hypothetical protein